VIPVQRCYLFTPVVFYHTHLFGSLPFVHTVGSGLHYICCYVTHGSTTFTHLLPFYTLFYTHIHIALYFDLLTSLRSRTTLANRGACPCPLPRFVLAHPGPPSPPLAVTLIFLLAARYLPRAFAWLDAARLTAYRRTVLPGCGLNLIYRWFTLGSAAV